MTGKLILPAADPPERRQVIAATLLVAAIYLPLSRFLDWRITGFVGLCLLLRLSAVRWPRLDPGRITLLSLTFFGALNCFQVYHSLAGKLGGTALFATMLALKLLELKQRRDLRVVSVVIGFLVVVQFLFDQTLSLAVYQGLAVFGAVALLVDLNGGLGPTPARTAPGIALRLSAQALPLALVMFLLFPRLSAPLWNLGASGESAVTGMSDQLEPGAISELVVNGELAFRVRFDRTPPPPDQLYWRGPVLWQVENRRWSLGLDPASRGSGIDLKESGDTIGYEVLLEPTKQRWLFALDVPLTIPPNSLRSADLQLLSPTPINTQRRYRVDSALGFRTAEPRDTERRAGLALPENVTERMRGLVRQWQAQAADEWGVVEAGLRYFNREQFYYTLLPPRLGDNPTDEFLFRTRAGFCEHYASSFALLMRIAGLPSRVVLGYLGGELNQIGRYHMVRQSDAHAWVEVAIAGRGWVRVDPTASVNPTRVDNSGASRILGDGASVRFEIDRDGLIARSLRQAMFLADSVQAAWQEWVLDFSIDNQLDMLGWLGLRAYGAGGLALLMIILGFLVLGLLLHRLIRQESPLSPLERLYQRFCSRLAVVGLSRESGEGPWDYGQRVIANRPDLAEPVGRFLSAYITARYSKDGGPGTERELAAALKEFRPRRSKTRPTLAAAAADTLDSGHKALGSAK